MILIWHWNIYGYYLTFIFETGKRFEKLVTVWKSNENFDPIFSYYVFVPRKYFDYVMAINFEISNYRKHWYLVYWYIIDTFIDIIWYWSSKQAILKFSNIIVWKSNENLYLVFNNYIFLLSKYFDCIIAINFEILNYRRHWFLRYWYIIDIFIDIICYLSSKQAILSFSPYIKRKYSLFIEKTMRFLIQFLTMYLFQTNILIVSNQLIFKISNYRRHWY